jgi:hypothetical protein
MSEIKVDQLSPRTASGTITLGSSGDSLTIPSGVTLTNNGTASGFGRVLQVVTVDKTDTFSLATTVTWTDITGLSVAITPSSTSNKILVGINLSVGYSVASTNMFRITRDGTAISVGDSDGSRRQATVGWYPGVNSFAVHGNLSYNYLDSPSTTSSVTYKVQANIENPTFYLNRTGRDSNSASQDGRRTSNIVLMEIAG